MNSQMMRPGGREVMITIGGVPVTAWEGEPLAAVFLRMDDIHTRTSFPSGQHRAPFCMMGVCFECLVHVEGRGSTRSCQEPVTAGMAIERHDTPKRLE